MTREPARASSVMILYLRSKICSGRMVRGRRTTFGRGKIGTPVSIGPTFTAREFSSDQSINADLL